MDLFGDMNMTGLASIIVFYLLILGVGMWAARKKSDVEGVSEEVGIKLSFIHIEAGLLSFHWIQIRRFLCYKKNTFL